MVAICSDSSIKGNQPVYSPISLRGTDCKINSQVSLAGLTSFRVGGPAEWYVAPRSIADLQASFAWADTEGMPVTLLGAGSNLLVSDGGLPGLVVATRYLKQVSFNEQTGQVTAGAGESIPRLAWLAAKRGWRGLEWAVGIPGTVGGAVVMNAGAHGGCTAGILVNARLLSPGGKVEILSPQDLGYRYRTSVLQGGDRLVTEATFQLQPGFDRAIVMEETNTNFSQRRTTQPYHLPSCGSVFRNPRPKAAGWLIEQSGLKGYQIGGAQVAQRHANFILNCGSATANDIFHLIRHVQEQVHQRWSLLLEPEVRILGEFPF
ncbi:MAG: UDP-N-acetylmuramate dehydrogenase [Microcoleus sp. SU_5_6]|nr:UDP-N-acetylmuramate dehydrogenase [Microcoleus sp. SU_5_6]